MTKDDFFIMSIIATLAFGFGIGLFTGMGITEEKLKEQQAEYAKKLEVKQLALDIAIVRNKECRDMFSEMVDELDYIQPRPITID